MNNILKTTLITANIPSQLEPVGLDRTHNGKRREGYFNTMEQRTVPQLRLHEYIHQNLSKFGN